ncbi:MAG: hypothetical protein LBC77_04520 [Spirochaetaceae bacterium]|jgi:hypothetical protein|nr:hypothetical protein [Spirochaetaceae bacterium]
MLSPRRDKFCFLTVGFPLPVLKTATREWLIMLLKAQSNQITRRLPTPANEQDQNANRVVLVNTSIENIYTASNEALKEAACAQYEYLRQLQGE